MKRSIMIAVAALALGAPLAPAAFARDGYDRHDDYRGEYRRGDHDRDDGGSYRGDRHVRGRRFVVHYHLDGRGRSVQAKSYDRARRIEDFLRSVGAHVRVGPGRVVYYRMRGEGETFRYSHEDAHRLVQKLEGYGFHAHVDHE